MKKLIYILISITIDANAVNLGTFGETFAIFENDLIESIQIKLKNLERTGILQQHQTNIQQQIINSIERPAPFCKVVKTKTPRVFMYNPTVRVPQDLTDHQGKIFAKQGTLINPLNMLSLTKSLIFIDGDDPLQVDWSIKSNPSNSKIILTNGAPFRLSSTYNRTFYFDQNGSLVKKFGISQVPARVSQKDRLLQVEEILL